MLDQINERIYEAAFVPELWPDVLERIARYSGAASGELMTFTATGVPIFKTTPLTHDAMEHWIGSGLWMTCEKPMLFQQAKYSGFMLDSDYMTEDELARDPSNKYLATFGLSSQVGSLINLPTGDLVAFTFERWLTDGPPDRKMAGDLDAIRPHLARSAMIAARLGLEQARAIVSALEGVGMPAAVLKVDGVLMASNTLFDNVSQVLRPAAFGKVELVSRKLDEMFQLAVQNSSPDSMALVRSIAIPGTEKSEPMIVHVLPIRRNARDFFTGANVLVTITTLNPSRMVPAPSLIEALFDLAPSEARLAADLAAGASLKDVSARSNITYSTARTYLDRVFSKTGTRRQAELVAMLKGVFPVVPDQQPDDPD